MIRGHSKHISVTDKLKFLWCLCLIAHYKEQGKAVSWYNIEQEFGKETNAMFNVYREYAMDYQYVKDDSHTLTDKGKRTVANWRHISNRIYW